MFQGPFKKDLLTITHRNVVKMKDWFWMKLGSKGHEDRNIFAIINHVVEDF